MDKSLLPTLLAATIAGSVTALFVTRAQHRCAASSSGLIVAAPAPEAAAATGGIEAKVAALRSENDALRSRIEALEGRPLGDSRAAVTSVEEVAAAAAAKLQVEGKIPPASGEVFTQVEQALETIRAAEREEATRAREQRELDHMEERLGQLAERLDLTSAQVNDLRAHRIAQQKIEDDLRAQRETGMERDAYRVAREQARSVEREELARILTPQQLEQYNARNDRVDRARDGGRGGNGNAGGADNRGGAGGKGGAPGAGRGGDGGNGGGGRRGN
ncbi:MAG: hypothetical protein FJ298_05390 [Planctomycetes bacterium]|nr:hypothetical protein [Planctomycetota bacterium]